MAFRLPPLLSRLIAARIWPSDAEAVWGQYQRPLASRDQVRRFAAEEDELILWCPPFRSVAEEVASAPVIIVNEFWKRYGLLDQIVPESALILGDFGLGSDAPIILNYAVDAVDPPVFRLRYPPNQPMKWVQGARTFDEFATILGLTDRLTQNE